VSAGAWFVWTGGRSSGAFATCGAAVDHCALCANDHRVKREVLFVHDELVRYTGPRGRRHGIRLIAYVGTARALAEIGVTLPAPASSAEAAGA